MGRERSDQLAIIENDFKGMVFANNPELYAEMYKEEFAPSEEDIEWRIPSSESEVRELLEEMREAGVNVRA